MVLLATLLSGCGQVGTSVDNMAGERLEAASIAAGLVADPAAAPLDGIWSRDTDRMCIVPGSSAEGDSLRRIGIVLDYGEGQGCAASGTLERSGADLKLAFGQCRFTARFDGDNIQFPAGLPAACNNYCSGRATLSALIVERVSASVAEARALRSAGGKPLCSN